MKTVVALALIMFATFTVPAQNNDLSPWSFTAEYGLSSLDGDGDASVQLVYGVSAEYTFLSFAGLSVDYYRFPLQGPAFSTALNAADVNITINVNRLLFSNKDDKIVLKGFLGYGIASYTTRYTSPTTPSTASTYGSASSFPVVGISVEFALIKTLSLGLKSQFRPFNQNNLEGDPRYNLDNTTNDNIVALTFFVRVKLPAAD